MKLTKSQLKQIIKEELEKVLNEDKRDVATRWEADEVIKNIRGNDFIHPGQQFVVNHDETTEDARIIGVSIDINGNPEDPGYGQKPQWASGEAYKILSHDLDEKATRMKGPHRSLGTGRLKVSTFREMKLTKQQLKQIIKEELNEIHITGEDIAIGLAHEAVSGVVNTRTAKNELAGLSLEERKMLDEDIRNAVINIIRSYLEKDI